jgi:hypothetical protein
VLLRRCTLDKAIQKVKDSSTEYEYQYAYNETIIDECDFPIICVTQINGRKTIIDTNNITEIRIGEFNMSVIIKIKKNSGGNAFLIIETPDKAKILYDRLKEICKIKDTL